MIYILDNDPKNIAKYLDDKSLDRMIKDIAQVLCNVHCSFIAENDSSYKFNIQQIMDIFKLKDYYIKTSIKLYDKWSQWSRERKNNYLYLIEIGFSLYTESVFRFGITKFNAKYRDIIRWCYDNVPDLPECPHGFCSHSKGNDGEDAYGAVNWENKVFIYCKEKYESITQFPLITPKRYIVDTDSLDFALIKHVIESYRNYYRIKLKQKPCRKHDACIYADEDKRFKKIPVWTKRSKPEWLIVVNNPKEGTFPRG